MKNKQVADILYEISELLSLTGGGNRFRVVAYQRASQAVESLPESIEDLARVNKLEAIPGIGESIAEKINEYLATGKIAYLEDLRGKYPAGLIDIMSITGMGPKKAKAIYERLHVENVGELLEAARKRRIRDLPGFGAKTEENILKGIEFKEKSKGRILLFDAMLQVEEIIGTLKKNPSIRAVDAAGSLRRRRETIGDIDILCAVDKGKEGSVIEQFTGLPGVQRILASGGTKVSIVTEREIQVDLRIIEPAVYGAALQYFTGSKAHNVTLRGYARQRGLTISEYGVFKIGKKQTPVAARTEAEVYGALDMPYIPPEIREDRGEIAAALEGRLPKLLELKDIKGDCHVHSCYSDGVNTIDEIGEKARQMGYEWIISCDHSPSLRVAHGLSIKDLQTKIGDIRRFNSNSRDVKILCGVEVDILMDGGLDYPDEILGELDFVIASIHSGFKQSERQITQRIVRALEHPLVSTIGHPSGRLINKRQAYAVDIDRVLEAARDTGKMLEINASPDRLDLFDFYCRRAKELGIMLSIGTDAHSLEHFEYMRLGVAVARRGWLEKDDVINTLSYGEVKKHLASMRRKTPVRP